MLAQSADPLPFELQLEAFGYSVTQQTVGEGEDVGAHSGIVQKRPVGDSDLDVGTTRIHRAGRCAEPRPVRAETAKLLRLGVRRRRRQKKGGEQQERAPRRRHADGGSSCASDARRAGASSTRSRHSIISAAIVPGPTNSPRRPMLSTPPRMPTSTQMNGSRVAPPMSAGRAKWSAIPTTPIPITKTAIAAPTVPCAISIADAIANTTAAPNGIIAATAVNAPKSSGCGTT